MFPPPSVPSAESHEAPLPPQPLMSQWLKVGVVVLSLYISAPEGAVLSQKMELVMVGELWVLYIPPPPTPAVLPLNVQLVMVGELL